ncbi:MAG: tRNA pseudouridine(38-40) synthase TruA [Thermoanaerobaculia bacterium]
MPTYRLTLEYEGTRYHGWQEQKNARSVAGELRRAIEESGGVVRELGGSGRTDAGVHALAQVAHLRLQREVDPEPFRRAVNDRLPADLHVLALASAADKFHSRHDAVSRSYLYQISRRRTALAKRFVWWVKRPLDERAMAEAASLLVGKHDFRLFCERPAEQPSTLVVVEGAEVVTDGALILVRMTASHFLWKMVRRVVGTLVQLGGGDLDRRGFEALLAARTPKSGQGLPAEWTAPPSGLFLERVVYKGDPPLGRVEPVVGVSAD